MSISIGVLAVQGDVQENAMSARQALDELGREGRVSVVSSPAEISEIDCLILPGGESTAIGQMSLTNGSLKAIQQRVKDGMPVLGICAGLVLLSSSASDRVVGHTGQPLVGAINARLERNSFGRQSRSFEADISLEPIGIPKFRGVFIRAPSIVTADPDIQILSKLDDKIVAVKKDNIVGTAFHPELAGDSSLYRYFVSLVPDK